MSPTEGSGKGPEVTGKSFAVNDLIEMFRHLNAERSQVELHDALGLDRKTIRKYLQPTLADGLEPARRRYSTNSPGVNASTGGSLHGPIQRPAH
ncbi:hypothetical protein RhoFasB10_05077 [Rhodococcus sp. B10]|nr:hypothetical protein [Rhodococcus sp. B10]